MLSRRVVCLGGLAALVLPAQEGKTGEGRSISPYLPSPSVVVEEMLRLGGLKKGEVAFDLGSGDGRIVIAAAKAGARATGIELNGDLVFRSRAAIARAGLEARARIVQGDLLKQDYRSADLVTLYLLPAAIEMVRPKLEEQLRRGARVVSHDYDVEGWAADRTIQVLDEEGRSHRLILYVR